MRYLVDENEDLATMPSTDTYLLGIATEQSSVNDDAESKIHLYGVEDNNSLQLLNHEDGWCNDPHNSHAAAVVARHSAPLQPLATTNLDVDRSQNVIFDQMYNVYNIESDSTCERNDIPKVIMFDKSAENCEHGTLDDCNSSARSALDKKRAFPEVNRQVGDEFGWDESSTILSHSTSRNKVPTVRREAEFKKRSQIALEVQNASAFPAPSRTHNNSKYSNYDLSASKMKSIVQYFWKEQLTIQCPTVAIKETELLIGIREREDIHLVSQSSIGNCTESHSRKRTYADTCYTQHYNTNEEFLPTNSNISFVTRDERSTKSSSLPNPMFLTRSQKRSGPNTSSLRFREQNRYSRYPLCRFVTRRKSVCAMVDRSKTGSYWRQQCRNYIL